MFNYRLYSSGFCETQDFAGLFGPEVYLSAESALGIPWSRPNVKLDGYIL